MNIKFNFKIEKEIIDASTFTGRMQRLVEVASKVSSFCSDWYMTPNGPRDNWVPLNDSEMFAAKVERDNPSDVPMIATITNRANEGEWYEDGRTTITFKPSKGIIQLEVSKADAFFGEGFFQTAKDILRAFVMEEWLKWASLGCSEKVPDDQPGAKKGKMRTIYLAQEYRTFLHREFLGWMGWIQQLPPKKLLQASDLPQAAEVHPLPGRSGTMVVSVGEAFDMLNPAHIEKMQRVEVRLVELGLLPVIGT